MKIKEEKTLILIELIMLLLITSATIIVEISDNIIADWQTETLFKMNKWNNLFSNFLDAKLESQFYGTLQPWAKYMKLTKNIELNLTEIDAQSNNISERVKKGDISVEDFIWEKRVHYAKKYADYWNKCEKQTKNVNFHLTKKPKFWMRIKSLCNLTRIISIFMAAFLYILLYRQISKRMK